MLAKNRDKKAAKRFFDKAIGLSGKPEKITIDKSGSNNAALKFINKGLSEKDKIEIRQIKYLNNIVEQDHGFIKRITKPMWGFKAFHSASSTLIGIELHHMIRKQQHINSANQSVFEHFYALAA
jgi:putative transposase